MPTCSTSSSESGVGPVFRSEKAEMYVGSDLFRIPLPLNCFNSVSYLLLWMCYNSWLFNRWSVNTGFQPPKNLFFNITNSRRLQIRTMSFWVLFYLKFCQDWSFFWWTDFLQWWLVLHAMCLSLLLKCLLRAERYLAYNTNQSPGISSHIPLICV